MLTRHGKEVAGLVPAREARLLEAMEKDGVLERGLEDLVLKWRRIEG